jgi:hypothetical protein
MHGPLPIPCNATFKLLFACRNDRATVQVTRINREEG